MQFRSACSGGAVSVASVMIFTTLPLQPTKCNFLRYVYEHREGRRATESRSRRNDMNGGVEEESRKREERERERGKEEKTRR